MKTDPDDCAFPKSNWPPQDGLTKREFFVAMAMGGLCALSGMSFHELNDQAIVIADETLAAMNRAGEPNNAKELK